MKKRLQLKNLEVKSFTTVQHLRGGMQNSVEPCEINSTNGAAYCTCGQSDPDNG